MLAIEIRFHLQTMAFISSRAKTTSTRYLLKKDQRVPKVVLETTIKQLHKRVTNVVQTKELCLGIVVRMELIKDINLNMS